MTQEEKAKAYDEALERAKKLHEDCDGKPVLGWYEYIFPELAESEDEKIRKWLIGLLSELQYHLCGDEREMGNKALAWVEKQGEIDVTNNEFKVTTGLYKCIKRMFDGTPDGKLLFEVGNIYKCLSKHDRAEFEVSYGHSVYLEDPIVRKHFVPYEEKQGEQKAINNTDEEIVEAVRDVSALDWIESKFNKGDWIMKDKPCQIIRKNDYGNYVVQYCDDEKTHILSRKYCDSHFHLWTIQDAKDGDVLYSPCHRLLWIFKSRDTVYCGCNLNYNDGAFCGEGYFEMPTDAIPTTKEQHAILSQKMKEAGYEWDAEEKELKKSQRMISAEAKEALYDKPAWSKMDEETLESLILLLQDYGSPFEGAVIDWLKSLKQRIGG